MLPVSSIGRIRFRSTLHQASWLAALAIGLAFRADCAPSSRVLSSDFEAWSEVDIYLPLSGRLNLLCPATIRVSDTLRNPVLVGFGPSLNIAVTKRVLITAGYLYVDVPHIGSGFKVNVPLAAITLSRTFSRWEFSDRNRGERLYGLPSNPFRYRNRVGGQFRFDEKWRLFASDEIFYDFGASSWNQNRLIAGIATTVNPYVTVDLFYLRRTVQSAPPGTTDGVGITLELHPSGISKKYQRRNL